MNLDEFKISGNKKFDFKNFDPGAKKLKLDKFEIANKSLVNLQRLGQFQDKFYAEGKESFNFSSHGCRRQRWRYKTRYEWS